MKPGCLTSSVCWLIRALFRYWEVTPDDVLRQISLLNLRPDREPQLLWIARLAAAAPLPAMWDRSSQEPGAKYTCSEWVHQAPGFGVSVGPGTDYFRDVVRAYREEYGGVDGGYSVASGEGAPQQISTMKFQDIRTGRYYLFDFVTNKPTEGPPAVGLQDDGGTASDAGGAGVSRDDGKVPRSGLDPTGSVGGPEGTLSCPAAGSKNAECSTPEDSQHGYDEQIWQVAQATCQAFKEASGRVDHLNDGLVRYIGALEVSSVANVVQGLCRELEKAECSARLAVKNVASAKSKNLERLRQRLELLFPVLQAELPKSWSIGVTPSDSDRRLSSDNAEERVFFIRGSPWPNSSTETSELATEDLSNKLRGSSNDNEFAALVGSKEARRKHIASHLQWSADAKRARPATGVASLIADEGAAVDPWWPNYATTQFPGTKALCRKWVKRLQKSLAERVANRSSNRASEQARLAERQQRRRQAARDAATAATASAAIDTICRFRVAASSVADMAGISASLMMNSTAPFTAPGAVQSPIANGVSHANEAVNIQTNLGHCDALHPLVSPLRSRSGSVQNVLASARAEAESDLEARQPEKIQAAEKVDAKKPEHADKPMEHRLSKGLVMTADIESEVLYVADTPPGSMRGPQRRESVQQKKSETRKWKPAKLSPAKTCNLGDSQIQGRTKQKNLADNGQNIETAPSSDICGSPLAIHSSKSAHRRGSGKETKSLWLKPMIQRLAAPGGPSNKGASGKGSSTGASLRRLSQAGVLGKDKQVLSLTLEQYLRQQAEERHPSKPLHPLQKQSPFGGIAHGLGPHSGYECLHVASNEVYQHGCSQPQLGENPCHDSRHFSDLPHKSPPLYSLRKSTGVHLKSTTLQQQSPHILRGGRGVEGGTTSSSSMFAL